MKKNIITTATVALAIAAFGAYMGSCSTRADKLADSKRAAREQEAKADSLRQAELTPEVKYDAAFFQNEANRADAPAEGKYVQTESGLKYAVIKEGTGARPTAEDKVTVNYHGMLTDMDATVFDSSYLRGEPATFPLSGVIKGWTEGLQYMPVGSVYEFYIPSDLAYGEAGSHGTIPPNAPLIFLVELKGIAE